MADTKTILGTVQVADGRIAVERCPILQELHENAVNIYWLINVQGCLQLVIIIIYCSSILTAINDHDKLQTALNIG